MDEVKSKQGKFTEEEYFEQLKHSEYKLEYLDGVIKSMAEGSLAHSTIAENTFFHLRANRGNCIVKASEMAVSIQSMNRYFFPDVSAVCNEEIKLEESKGIARMTNPCLIIEVLSESTADYDRGEKFRTYRQLESFKEYLLIDSRKLLIDYFYRESEELWHIRSYYKLDQEVEIRTLGVTLPVSAFYEGVNFPPETEER